MNPDSQNFAAKNVAESDLPGRLGVSRPLLRLLRDELLAEGADWELREKQIWLSETAVEKIAAGYGRLKDGSLADLKSEKSPPEGGTPNPEKKGAGGTAPSPALKNGGAPAPAVVLHELRVWKADGYAGGRMLLARTIAGKAVKVRVRSTEKFCPGMVLYASRVNGELYQFQGPYPRWRGERLYRPDTLKREHQP